MKWNLTIMNKWIAALAVSLSLLSPALSWDKKDMNNVIDSTNFLMNDDCSGTLLTLEYILTANHCITEQYKVVEREKFDEDGVVKKEKVRVVTPGRASQFEFKGPNIVQQTSYLYKIVKTEPDLDLALVKLDTPAVGPRALPWIACSEVERGDVVYAVGNSYGILYSSVTSGIVSSVQRSYRDIGLTRGTTDNGEHGFIQHSAPIVGGNSGGAVYNGKGEFAGVNVRGGATGFSLAVPLADVKKLLRREGLADLWKRCE